MQVKNSIFRCRAHERARWCATVTTVLLFVCLLTCPAEAQSAGPGISPFRSVNQSPLIQIYGIPRDTGADIVPPGSYLVALDHDLGSNYTAHINSHETLLLDGETNRTTLSVRYGIAPRLEAGIQIPYLVQGGGFLDDFIVSWHDTFGLPQGGRDAAPRNRLYYGYKKDGTVRLLRDHGAAGVGDITLTGGYALYDDGSGDRHDRLALKAGIKLPTGESAHLLGSGGTDVSLLVCGGSDYQGDYGMLALYGSLGGVVMTRGDLLRDQHNPVAGVASLGAGWRPAGWIEFKLQLNGTTPLYHDSSLAELSSGTLLLTMGGAFLLPGGSRLDLGVGEDIAVATAPDVSFHVGLTTRF